MELYSYQTRRNKLHFAEIRSICTLGKIRLSEMFSVGDILSGTFNEY